MKVVTWNFLIKYTLLLWQYFVSSYNPYYTKIKILITFRELFFFFYKTQYFKNGTWNWIFQSTRNYKITIQLQRILFHLIHSEIKIHTFHLKLKKTVQ